MRYGLYASPNLGFGIKFVNNTALLASRMKKIRYVAPVTAIVTGFIVGAELYAVLGLPFIASVISVTIGEFVVVLIGTIGAKALSKNTAIQKL